MLDGLKEQLMEKAGLDASMADKAVDVVKGFLKDNPDKVKGLLEGGIGGKLGGLFD